MAGAMLAGPPLHHPGSDGGVLPPSGWTSTRWRGVRLSWRLFAALALVGCLTVLQAIWPLWVDLWGAVICLALLPLLGGIAGYRLCAVRVRRLVARARCQVAVFRARALSAEAERELTDLLESVKAEAREMAA